MSQYYNAQRSRNLYNPGDDKPFRISRSKIDLFSTCPRCFYIDRRLGTGQPPGYPFAINSAVDALLKKEFDVHRTAGTQHPLQAEAGDSVIPADHPQIDEWRENFKGVQALHAATNLIITGAIDDLWIDGEGRHFVVDYKATAKAEPVKALDQAWQDGYKRQMEVYQWLLRQNGLDVSDTGYFVYCTGRAAAASFDAQIDFDIHVIPYSGNDAWVDPAIVAIHRCLNSDEIPMPGTECDHCAYVNAVHGHLSSTNRTLL
jgi:hypothetical protein